MISKTKLAGRYLLETQIAAGHYALVWRALDERLDRLVAVKILKHDAASDPELRSTFLRAAHAGARLNHPNIASVYETGEHEGAPFVVMEYLEGGTLAGLLATGPLPLPRAALIARAACSALAYSHAQGIAHAELKATNLLLTSRGHPKLSDFGGPAASGDTKDRDLRAVGGLLYEMLTGRTPPAAGRIARPSDFRSDIPRPLDALAMRALQPNEGSRIEASDLARALEPFALDEASQPPPTHRGEPAAPSFVSTEGRWLLRVALIVVLAALVTFAALNLAGKGPLPQLFRPEPKGQPIEIASGGIFDPPEAGGNGAENNEEVPRAFDGDTDTAWGTEWYRTPNLGGAKPGVGLTIDLGTRASVERIEILSVEGGWAGSVRHSDDGTGWSDPEPSVFIDKEEAFDLDGKHRYWMIWITQLVRTPGQGRPDIPYSVGIAEVSVFGS